MKAATAQRLVGLGVFINRDLPRLRIACDHETLPFAKLLHHIRLATLDLADLISDLDPEIRSSVNGQLADVLCLCERISQTRGQPPNWVRGMLPDLHAALCSEQPREARIREHVTGR